MSRRPRLDRHVEAFCIAAHDQVLVFHVLTGVEAIKILIGKSSVAIYLPIARGGSWLAERKVNRDTPDVVDASVAQHVTREALIQLVRLDMLRQALRAKNIIQAL
jgi:hypothetical protein